MQRPWRTAASCFAPHGLPSLLLIPPGPPAQGYPTHREVGPPTSIIIQENTLQACLQTDLMGPFFSVESLFSQ